MIVIRSIGVEIGDEDDCGEITMTKEAPVMEYEVAIKKLKVLVENGSIPEMEIWEEICRPELNVLVMWLVVNEEVLVTEKLPEETTDIELLGKNFVLDTNFFADSVARK